MRNTALVPAVPAARGSDGRFQPGFSGNPKGRPAVPSEVREAAQHHTLAAIDLLATVLHDTSAPMSARFMAAREILKAAAQRMSPHELEAARTKADLFGLSDDAFEQLLVGSGCDDEAV